jgi:hypothetical protein
LLKIFVNNAASNPILDIKGHRTVEKSFESNPEIKVQHGAANS